MTRIDCYIFKQLIMTAVFVTAALTFAVWLAQSLRLFDYIVNRGLPADKFLLFAALLMPTLLGVVVPIAVFVAVLFVYNKLTVDSELVVLRAAGLSQLQLARPAILLGAGATVLVYLISLYLLPASYRAFKDLQHEIRNDYSAVLLQEGVFTEVQAGLTVYLRARSEAGELLGLMVHDSRDPARPITLMAKRGALVGGPSGTMVLMIDGNRQEVDRSNGRLSLLTFDRYTVELGQLGRKSGRERWREPKERYLHEIFGPPEMPEDQTYRKELMAEGHHRIVMPLYTIAFVLIGLACLLCGPFNRRGQPKRLLIAVCCVAALEALMLTSQDLASRLPQTIPAMYLSALLPSLLSVYLLLSRWGRGRRRDDGGVVVGRPA